MLAKKKESPKDITISTRKMINRVKKLNSFFLGKLQLISNKMNTIVNGSPDFIQKILDDDNNLREWGEWSYSFVTILRHERFISYRNGQIYIVLFFIIIDIMYKIEENISKIVKEV